VLDPLLSPRAEELLAQERRVLGNLRTLLAGVGADEEDQQALADSIEQLDRLFSLVVVGEFNAGKSVFVNALLGRRLLEEGVTPTTSRIHIVQWGEEEARRTSPEGFEVVEAPVELLRQTTLVDTPGTNAIDREHEALTGRFVPRSDLVLFLTSADRPFTESERRFMEQIREWGKKVVVVINKIDILESAEAVEQVRAFVAENAEALLGVEPEVFTISARRALAHALGEGDRGPDPGFTELEAHVRATLEDVERVRLKLMNPLGVGSRVANRQLEATEAQLELLAEDTKTLDDLQRQTERYREDLEREFAFRMGDIEKLVYRMESRGIAFFDERLRLRRFPELLNRSELQLRFEREVVQDLPQQLESQVRDLIDWMVESELRQWQAVTRHVRTRLAAHEDRVVGGSVESEFESSRAELLERLGRGAQRAIDDYDRTGEAQRMAESVKRAVAGTAALQAGAVGIGGLVALLASTTAADVTGILAAGVLASLGMFVIPAKRRQAKAELRERLGKLREQLLSGLQEEFAREVDRSLRRLDEAIGPYTRFVRAERERLEKEQEELRQISGEIAELRRQVEAL
jgi:small GTP-binding protein